MTIRDADDCRTRGTEASQQNRIVLTRLEKNAKQREGRAATMAELRLNKRPAGRDKGHSASDLFVVKRDDLMAIVGKWIEQQSLAASMPDIAVGGMSYLASEIGCSADRIRNLMRLPIRWISFGLADDLLTTLNMPMAFHDGRVPVYVNPRISYKTWCKRAKEQDVDCPSELWLLHSHPEAWAA